MYISVTIDEPVYATPQEIADEISRYLAELYATKVSTYISISSTTDGTALQKEGAPDGIQEA